MAASYTLDDIRRAFDEGAYQRGFEYAREGRAFSLDRAKDGALVALVQGSGVKPYLVRVKPVARPGGTAMFDTSCTCPVGMKCKHSVAVLVQGVSMQPKPQVMPLTADYNEAVYDASYGEAPKLPAAAPMLDSATEQWLRDVEKSSQPPGAYPPGTSKRIFYLLSFTPGTPKPQVTAVTVTPKADGSFGLGKPYQIHQAFKHNAPLYVIDEDRTVMRVIQRYTGYGSLQRGCAIPCDAEGRLLLEMAVATGRCYWQLPHPDNGPLRWADQRAAALEWEVAPDGTQRLQTRVEGETLPVLGLLPPCYVDAAGHSVGPLAFDGISPQQATALLAAPPIRPEQAEAVSARLAPTLVSLPQLLPKRFAPRREENIVPAPCLTLTTAGIRPRGGGRYWGYLPYGVPVDVAAAQLAFDYAGLRVAYGESAHELTFFKDGELVTVTRDAPAERRAMKALRLRGFAMQLQDATKHFTVEEKHRRHFSLGQPTPDFYAQGEFADRWVEFVTRGVPQLRAEGWIVEMDKDFPFNVVMAGDEWYGEIGEGSGIDWFGLELGVTVEGTRHNLLPILLNILKSNPDVNALGTSDPGSVLLVPLPDGRQLGLPRMRAHLLLKTIHDLYSFHGVDEAGRLKMQALEAALLAEIEAAGQALNLRWFGGEKIRALGKRLRDFQGVADIAPPALFHGQLRSYQQEGLNWLQFLREYELAGVLADDMGLGKTVQALAHIACEKAAGRLTEPFLVIAPTSLMANWRMEAARFAPDLSVLTLHGPERKAHFGQIRAHDLVLTTYPLLPRDKEALLACRYHTVLLDEAQTIKNARAKITQIVSQLKARHRLCMTGTPLENHLGELWSLFNFLLPGYLGDERKFRTLFRNPIEKGGDALRPQALSRRVKPFILRRTKQEVVKELPPKTEMLRMVEIDGAQRDLYETIRVSMHEKVRKEIAARGFEKSHIILLDALLKLRQTCCDPRLLKLEAAMQATQSAKLDELMDMLPPMIEEGRKVLLFSQFTSMLALIEERLKAQGIGYVLLTGQTKDRETPIRAFQEGKVPLFLISLKAGGTGLNLTAADTVIHYDPWWNPAVENQASDRAYRIGQDKPVFVYKLVTLGTVEEKILEMQQRKRQLADSLFDPAAKSTGVLSVSDIQALFEPLASGAGHEGHAA